MKAYFEGARANSYRKYLETLISELETTHNIVFASGGHIKLFLGAS